jgi:hypothetical protein
VEQHREQKGDDVDKTTTGPSLRLPIQAVPVTRSRNRVAVEAAAAGVEAATLWGFIKDLVSGDTGHMLESAKEDIWGWLSG